MSAIPHDSRLGPDITGTCRVPTEILRRSLGYNAFLVWQILCARRDSKGLTHITLHGIRTAKNFDNSLSEKRIQDALVRLRLSGLVKDCQYRRYWAAEGYWSFDRKVLGCTATAPGQDDIALVPTKTWQWIQTASGHGGARVGAGRKKKTNTTSRPANPEKLDVDHDLNSPVDHDLNSPVDHDLNSKTQNRTPVRPPKTEFKSWYTSKNSSRGLRVVTTEDDCEYQKSDEIAREAVSKSSRGPELYILDQVTEVVPSELLAPPKAAVESESTNPPQVTEGVGFGGTASLPPLVPGRDGIPARPTNTLLPRPETPPPPKLPEGLSDLDSANWLMNAYRGAVSARSGKRCFILAKKGALEKSDKFKLLVEAAKAMREYDIAPAAWVAWRVDHWYAKTPKKTPPLSYVFASAFLVEKHGWFGHEAEAYSGRSLIQTPTAQVVMQRWALMWRQLCALRERTPKKIEEVVERHFPGREYEMLVRQARQEAVDMQAELNVQVQRGCWGGW